MKSMYLWKTVFQYCLNAPSFDFPYQSPRMNVKDRFIAYLLLFIRFKEFWGIVIWPEKSVYIKETSDHEQRNHSDFMLAFLLHYWLLVSLLAS